MKHSQEKFKVARQVSEIKTKAIEISNNCRQEKLAKDGRQENPRGSPMDPDPVGDKLDE